MSVRSVFLSGLLALSITAWAQGSQIPAEKQPSGELKTFIDPDRTFQFNYSNALILCEQKPNGSEAGFYWAPAESCMAYHPVCDGLTPERYKALACLGFLRDEYTRTPAFEAATFSVEIVQEAATAKSCLAKPEYDTFTVREPIRIGGISFTVFDFAEAEMSQNVSGTLYRAFHRGKCYQFGIDVAQSGANDPPFSVMTKQESDRVNHVLEQARDSFRFLR
jgi:hypothetical protein